MMIGLVIDLRGEGASNTIFHVEMTLIKFLLILFDCMSITFSKRVWRLRFGVMELGCLWWVLSITPWFYVHYTDLL